MPLSATTSVPDSDPREPSRRALVDCRIGTMRVAATVDLPNAVSPRDVLLPGEDVSGERARYFGDVYKTQERRISDVVLDATSGSASARVAVLGDCATTGFSSVYRPTLSIIDGMLVLAQLSQALLYDIDGLTRANSDNLWMRRFTIDTHWRKVAPEATSSLLGQPREQQRCPLPDVRGRRST